MKKIRSQKGQALILIALAVVGLVGFTALTIDGGRVLSDRRHAQNTADTSVLAAALAKIKGNNYVDAARNRAANNGYTNGVNNATVEVILCGAAPSGDPCQGLPTTADTTAEKNEYIRVRIHSFVPTTFARVLGRTQVENTVEAIARVQGSTTTTSPFGSAGMVSVKNDNSNDCFHFNGAANVTIHGSGIIVGCTGTEALVIDGNTTLKMDAGAQIGGCKKLNGSSSVTGALNCDISLPVINQSTFASLPTTSPAPTCPSPGFKDTIAHTYSPGNYPNNETINASYTFTQGNYCFPQGFSVNGNGNNIQQSDTGTVRIVMGGDFGLGNGSTNTFKDLEFYFSNADLKVNGSLKSDRFRFFATGTGNLKVNANGTLESGNAYIYSYRGEYAPNSSAISKLKAPPPGDLFAGILIYMPWDASNLGKPWNLNGQVSSDLWGTILAPTRDITPNGGADTKIHGQIIGYTFRINGNHKLDIYYDPAAAGGSPNAPTIELTK